MAASHPQGLAGLASKAQHRARVTAAAPNPRTEAPPGEWARNEACVGYDVRGHNLHGMHMVQRTADGRMERRAWPKHYNEGSPALVCGDGDEETAQGCTPKARRGRGLPSTAEAVDEWPQVWHEGAEGFVVTLTMDNIWHVLFHAVRRGAGLKPLPGRDSRRPRSPAAVPHYCSSY